MGQRNSSRLRCDDRLSTTPRSNAIVKKLSEPVISTSADKVQIATHSQSERRRTKSDAKPKREESVRPRTKSEIPSKRTDSAEFDYPGRLNVNGYQISALQLGWLQARSKGSREPALSIFRHFFNDTTEIQQTFNKKSSYSGGESTILQVHVDSFNQLMDEVLKNLSEERQLLPTLFKIGRKHSHFRSSGFKPCMWDKLAEILVESSLEWNLKRGRTLESQAWTNVILFLVATMNEGYKRERIRMRGANGFSTTT